MAIAVSVAILAVGGYLLFTNLPGSSGPAGEATPTGLDPSLEASPNPSPEPSAVPEPSPWPDNEPLLFANPRQITVDLHYDIPEYNPERNVMPVVGSKLFYNWYVSGEVIFLKRGGGRVDLPDGVTYYYPSPHSYALKKDNKLAFMNYNGEILTDFIYEEMAFGDYPYYPSFESYLGVYRDGKMGLLDLQTGRESIPCVYDGFELLDEGFILAREDSHYTLIDFDGHVLYDFGDIRPGVTHKYGGSMGDPRYELDAVNKALYTFDVYEYDGDDYSIWLYKHFVVQRLSGADFYDDRRISLYTYGGEHVGTVLCSLGNVWEDAGGNVLLEDTAARNQYHVVTPEGELITFPVQVMEELYLRIWPNRYQDGFLVLRYSESDTDETYECYINQNGELARKESILPDSPPAGELLLIEYDKERQQNICSLTDGNGKVIKVFDAGTYVFLQNGFVFACRETYEEGTYYPPTSVSYDIYDTKGTLIAANPYGIVFLPAFENNMIFIYRSPDDGGFLYADGRFEPVPGLPPVEFVYCGA